MNKLKPDALAASCGHGPRSSVMKCLENPVCAARALALVAGTMLFAPDALADGWRSYHNDRFGTTADIPAAWRMQPPPENDDGRIFVSPDGRGEIIVNGNCAGVVDPDELGYRLRPSEGETIAYKQRKGDWAVVSGTKGDRIFYRKTLLSCGGEIANNFSIQYPASEKSRYDSVVAHVEAPLKAGDGWGVDKKCK
jgi:hypothetical protein